LTGRTGEAQNHSFSRKQFDMRVHEPLRRRASEWVSPFDAGLTAADLRTIQVVRPNVLLIGPSSGTFHVIDALVAFVEPPIFRSVGAALRLPPSPRAALIIQDVDQLSAADQQKLHGWLTESAGAAQVIATTTVPLLPLVEQRRFLDELYYRLNTMCFEVGSPSAA
jgi:hypothetical protein